MGVPLNLDILSGLKASSLAMDLYVWNPYRIYLLKNTTACKVFISIQSLREQFMPNSKYPDWKFWQFYVKALHKFLAICPNTKEHDLLRESQELYS